MAMESLDCVVIGAGVVGLAVGRALALKGRDVVVVDAGPGIGWETSSRNSEVIHAGIYYPAGSLKARLCVEGKHRLYAYCAERGIPHARCGKLIVGTRGDQQPELDTIRARAAANGVTDLVTVDRAGIRDLEPEVEAVIGLLSPSTGIVDSHSLMLNLQGDIENTGGVVLLRTPVEGGTVTDDGILLRMGGADPVTVRCRLVVNAGGLHAQDVARAIGVAADRIPARHMAIGHYYTLSGRSPFRRLVYPVPEDGGLGVHVTLDMGGQAKFGPDVRWIDRIDYSFDDGRRDAFVAAIRAYYPGLDPERLVSGYTGIRPKLVGPGGGFADFRIDGPAETGATGLACLYGIESPGLTSSLAIAELLAERLVR